MMQYITIYTIQPEFVLGIIAEQGYYECDISKSRFYQRGSIKNAYHWLREQMNQKIRNPHNVQFPIWGWAKIRRLDLSKPKFTTLILEPGTDAVCLKLKIPLKDVVLTDFYKWDSVIRNQYLPSSSENIVDYVAKLKELKRLEKNDLTAYATEVIKSWDNVFCIEKTTIDVQATFWRIEQKYIQEIIHIDH